MSKSKNNGFTTQRTYRFSERCRLSIDQLSILLPGVSKEDIMAFSVFWTSVTFKELIEKRTMTITLDFDGDTIRLADAMSVMQDKIAESGYEETMTAIASTKGYTRLDRFFELGPGGDGESKESDKQQGIE